MEMHLQYTDEQFETLFKNCELDSAVFTHEAHLRLAWVHVKKYGVEIAIINICNQLQAYVNHLGAIDKYNHTLTIAAVKAVAHFVNRSKTENFVDLIEEFPKLKFKFRELMEAHYSINIFTSAEAKKVYLEPDLLPFT